MEKTGHVPDLAEPGRLAPCLSDRGNPARGEDLMFWTLVCIPVREAEIMLARWLFKGSVSMDVAVHMAVTLQERRNAAS